MIKGLAYKSIDESNFQTSLLKRKGFEIPLYIYYLPSSLLESQEAVQILINDMSSGVPSLRHLFSK